MTVVQKVAFQHPDVVGRAPFDQRFKHYHQYGQWNVLVILTVSVVDEALRYTQVGQPTWHCSVAFFVRGQPLPIGDWTPFMHTVAEQIITHELRGVGEPLGKFIEASCTLQGVAPLTADERAGLPFPYNTSATAH